MDKCWGFLEERYGFFVKYFLLVFISHFFS
jgi:hypothetical protein